LGRKINELFSALEDKMIKQEVVDDGLIADFFTAEIVQPRKAIIMLGGSEGGKSWSRKKKLIELMVQKGYSVLSLAYFKAQGLPNSLEAIPLEYFEKAFTWLSGQKGIVANEYAILGGSKGAEAALVLGSKYPHVKAVIAFCPSCAVWQGIPQKRFEIGKNVSSSWSYKGENLPFLAYPASVKKIDLLLLRLREMHEEALQNTASARNSAIEVENIQGSIFLISGKRDQIWPATDMSEVIMERLKSNDFKFYYEHISYDTGHFGIIMNKECWRKIFSFLEDHFA
jgi:esterase/lipase